MEFTSCLFVVDFIVTATVCTVPFVLRSFVRPTNGTEVRTVGEISGAQRTCRRFHGALIVVVVVVLAFLVVVVVVVVLSFQMVILEWIEEWENPKPVEN